MAIPDILPFRCPATSILNVPGRISRKSDVLGGVSTANLMHLRSVLEARFNESFWNADLTCQRQRDRVEYVLTVPPNYTNEAGAVPSNFQMTFTITMVETGRLSRAEGVDTRHDIRVSLSVLS